MFLLYQIFGQFYNDLQMVMRGNGHALPTWTVLGTLRAQKPAAQRATLRDVSLAGDIADSVMQCASMVLAATACLKSGVDTRVWKCTHMGPKEVQPAIEGNEGQGGTDDTGNKKDGDDNMTCTVTRAELLQYRRLCRPESVEVIARYCSK